MPRQQLSWRAIAVVGVALAATAPAGPIDPPPGPVASTYKTLDEVEPRIPISAERTPGDATATFVLSEPGSYYLPAPLTGEAGKNGIEVRSPDVTIDLMGMSLSGGAGTLNGIFTGVNENIVVRNGIFRDWSGGGVRAFTTDNGLFEDLVISGTTSSGLSAGDGCLVRNVVVTGCGGAGITVGNRCTVLDCTAHGNIGSGIAGGESCTVRGCTAVGNFAHGFSFSRFCTFVACTANDNAQNGFNIFNGFSTLSQCTAASNDADGFFTNTGSSIMHCAALANEQNQIEVASQSFLFANHCRGANNVPGVYVTGDYNRIDSNAAIFLCQPGFRIEGIKNLIVRNSASNNVSDYLVGPQNTLGLVEEFQNGGTVQIQRPWSNFRHGSVGP